MMWIPFKTKMNNNDTRLKIVFIGETGCGKSTLINALIGKIVLPESPMTCTPILTFIEYSNQETDYAEIIDRNQRIIEKIEIEPFIKKYCFNVEEQYEVDRERFSNISHAIIRVNASFLKNGVQIIDTLGYSASCHDTETTKSILSNNIDLIFYVVFKNMLGDFEVERIQNLLGYRSDKQIRSVHEPICRKTSLSKLYFICNEKDGIIVDGLQKSISRIFYSEDCNRSATQMDNFAREHILKCNFLVGRTLNCGIYPYSKYFSFSPAKDEIEFTAAMERRQNRYLKITDKDDEYLQWKATRKEINRIIEKKRKDIEQQLEQQRINRIALSLSYLRTCSSDSASDKFPKLLDKANQGVTNSQVLVGLAYDKGDKNMNVAVDYRKAFMWYQRAATKGNAHGQYRLAIMYEEGKYVQKNLAEAIYWYKESAKRGYAKAQVKMGLLCEKGNGIDQSYTDALLWYKKASEQNDSDAQFYIALMYTYGVGVEQNLKAAYLWLKKAAASDNMYAMYYLGLMYENGDGVMKDYTEAFNWYKKSALLGYDEARKKIKNWR